MGLAIKAADIKYEEKIGSGAAGKVYKAVNLRSNTPIAVKVMKLGGDWDRYIRREVETMKSLEHVSLDHRGFSDAKSVHSLTPPRKTFCPC
jgi:serine/threonine protein kinase